MANIIYPIYPGARGIGYWLYPKNLLASRQKFMRVDYSNEWRYEFGAPDPLDRSVKLSRLLSPLKDPNDGYRIVILGDTGEGDKSQYGLLPLIREVKPDMLIINGDVAYPAGRMVEANDEDDFIAGFFKPYSNLDLPIWATPGNHEYYSPNNGRDFYDIFCTRKYDRYWSNYGLRHNLLQPGMFWELSDTDGNSKLVILGMDSGKSANLDGHNDWWQFWKRKITPDHTQHRWFDERLRKAVEKGSKVIVLFHIPALAKEKQLEEHLSILHYLIADYNCVKLVLCGHDHNHQQYSSQTFSNYIKKEAVHRDIINSSPEYMVNGGGGAFLQSTGYPKGTYYSTRYPNSEEWIKYAGWGYNVVSKFGKNKNIISKIAGSFAHDAQADADEPLYLSFILVEYKPVWNDGSNNEIRVTPVFLDKLDSMYDFNDTVDVMDKNHHIDPLKVKACYQNVNSPRGNLEVRF